MAPYVRTVKTASGATAVQIVHRSRRGARDIEHIGSAHDDAQLALLKAAARQRMAAGQLELDFGVQAGESSGALTITSSRMGHLWDARRWPGEHTLTAADPLPDDLRQALTNIHSQGAH